MTDPEKLLCQLIALPSVNPAFLPARDRRAGEGRVAEFLAATFTRAGLDTHFQKVQPGRSNLLATLPPSGNARHRVLLAPHLDTVPATDDAQYAPRLRASRIYGRGACDTKGSVAAMLTALCRVAKHGPRPAETEIVFAGLVDEEHGQSGSRALAVQRLQSGFGDRRRADPAAHRHRPQRQSVAGSIHAGQIGPRRAAGTGPQRRP